MLVIENPLPNFDVNTSDKSCKRFFHIPLCSYHFAVPLQKSVVFTYYAQFITCEFID